MTGCINRNTSQELSFAIVHNCTLFHCNAWYAVIVVSIPSIITKRYCSVPARMCAVI